LNSSSVSWLITLYITQIIKASLVHSLIDTRDTSGSLLLSIVDTLRRLACWVYVIISTIFWLCSKLMFILFINFLCKWTRCRLHNERVFFVIANSTMVTWFLVIILHYFLLYLLISFNLIKHFMVNNLNWLIDYLIISLRFLAHFRHWLLEAIPNGALFVIATAYYFIAILLHQLILNLIFKT
jgi:hypothetical protein